MNDHYDLQKEVYKLLERMDLYYDTIITKKEGATLSANHRARYKVHNNKNELIYFGDNEYAAMRAYLNSGDFDGEK